MDIPVNLQDKCRGGYTITMKPTKCLVAIGAIVALTSTGMTQEQEASRTGSISGTVKYEGQAATPRMLKVDKDLEVCGTHAMYSEELLISKTGGLQNVVVQVVGAKGEVVQPATRPSIAQEGCQFIPHLLVIPAGARMNILNEDGIAHNIHTLSVDNPSFNIQQPGAKKRIVTKKNDFAIPETIPVKCDIHGWMKAWIIVADHPYHAVTDDGGSFEISAIPAGTYRVEFWHETLGRQTQEVTVKTGADTAMEVVFKPKK